MKTKLFIPCIICIIATICMVSCKKLHEPVFEKFSVSTDEADFNRTTATLYGYLYRSGGYTGDFGDHVEMYTPNCYFAFSKNEDFSDAMQLVANKYNYSDYYYDDYDYDNYSDYYYDIDNLTPATTYYYYFYAVSASGEEMLKGDVMSFTTKAELIIPVGAIAAEFSVAKHRKVFFSMGNLQYQASTHKWRFATHQYDFIGSSNSNISNSTTSWIDLFGWGTSGWYSGAVAYQPYSTSTTYSDYYPGGSAYNDLTGSYAYADWGVVNAIQNGGNTAHSWRTLTADEWQYLLYVRTDAASKCGLATVLGVSGLVILPDDWQLPSGCSFNASYSYYTVNIYNSTQWSNMEAAGAVFLPAAGYRHSTTVYNSGTYGNYWSANMYNSDVSSSYRMRFLSGSLYSKSTGYRYYGHSVRLVRNSD